jgi:hypothetical protein
MHSTDSTVIPRILSESRILLSVGRTTGTIALTKAFVMLVFRDFIDWTAGIRNAFRNAFVSALLEASFIAASPRASSRQHHSSATLRKAAQPPATRLPRTPRKTTQTQSNQSAAPPTPLLPPTYAAPPAASPAPSGKSPPFPAILPAAPAAARIPPYVPIFSLHRFSGRSRMYPNSVHTFFDWMPNARIAR